VWLSDGAEESLELVGDSATNLQRDGNAGAPVPHHYEMIDGHGHP
jgi:hypothetical protein